MRMDWTYLAERQRQHHLPNSSSKTVKVTHWLKTDILIFDIEIGNKKKYTKCHHTEGFTLHTSSPISLQTLMRKLYMKTNRVVLNIEFSILSLQLLSKNSYSGIDTHRKEFEFEAIWCLWLNAFIESAS